MLEIAENKMFLHADDQSATWCVQAILAGVAHWWPSKMAFSNGLP